MSTRDAVRAAIAPLEGPPASVLIVRAPYYRDIVDALSDGAARILAAAGATVTTANVTGAFELPQAIRLALRGTDRFDGFVALGCVVRGETSHYDHICDATMAGLMNVALTYGIALGTGLLTVETIDQALARARLDGGANKGEEAARACLGQIAVARAHGDQQRVLR